MLSGIAHINLLVPPGTLEEANTFYGTTLGLTAMPVPPLQKDTTAWFNITPTQQIHIAIGANHEKDSPRHPCFRAPSLAHLEELKRRIYAHYERGGSAAPLEADRPGERDSGEQGVEYPTRFFARDYAGNRLEFSL